MVDESEGEGKFWFSAIDEVVAFGSKPSLVRGGVGQVEGQRENICGPLPLQLAIEEFDRGKVRIERDDEFGSGGENSGKFTGIAAEVPGHLPGASGGDALDEFAFEPVVLLGVCVFCGVSGPVGSKLRGRKLAYDFLQSQEVVADHRGVEGRSRFRGGDRSLVFRGELQLMMQPNVDHDAGFEEIAPTEETGDLPDFNSIEGPPEPRLEGKSFVRGDHQRKEKSLAELSVSGPRLSLSPEFEGSDVDERGGEALPLHVISGAVLGDDLFIDCTEEDLKVQESGIPEHAPGPFVGV